MPAPATVDEFLDLVRKTGVIDETKLNAYLEKQKLIGPFPAEPGKCAGKFVRDAVLTFFQAEQLLQGKWKRFTIGKYKVLEKLGVGGMGQVFLCEHKLMRRRVAVKVLPAAKGQDDASRERFYQEARAVAALDHPNIVRAYDIDHDEGLHFLVMEFVDGVNLQDLVKRAGPLDPLRACHYIYGSAVGLQYASETGIVHRDIKPGNILIDRSGVVKILDMGLARFFNDEDDSLTKKYDENVLGTADYLAPEQAVDSHTVTIRADLYSLGGTFYFLLTGQPPFPEGSVAQKLLWHQTRDPKPIRQVRPEVPAEIAAIVEKLMKKSPDERYQTPGDLMAVLQEFVQVPIPPPSEKELPPLSPAAAGTTAATNRASSGVLLSGGNPMVSTTQSSFEMRVPTGAGVPGSSSHDRPRGTATATAPQTADVQVGVWATLDGDTAPRDSVETARTARPDSKKGTKAPTAPKPGKSRKKLAIGASIALGVIALAAGAYFLFKPPSAPPVAPAPAALDFSRVYVTKGTAPAGFASFPSVRDAVNAISKRPEFDEAKRGDARPTIVLMDEIHQELPIALTAPNSRLKDLIVESQDAAKPVVWTTPAGANVKTLLVIRNLPGLTLRNVVFDAESQMDVGLVLSGSLPGVRLENVAVRGARKTGIRFENAAGEVGKPCVLHKLKITVGPDADAAIHFAIPDRGDPSTGKNAYITIENSRLEGPASAAVAIDTPLVSVEFKNNRVHHFLTGLAVRQPTTLPWKLTVRNNTFHTIAGNAMHAAEFDLPIASDIALSRNYFAESKGVAVVKNIANLPKFQSPDNARDAKSGDGNLPTKAKPIDGYTLPPPVKNADDAAFLRYAKSSPLWTAGPNKTPVGAPPE
jgi:eukaryotic-like serine/threonine-protein kinase